MASKLSKVIYRLDGKQLASSDGWGIQLWKVKSGECQAKLEDHKSGVSSLLYHPLGYLASADVDGTLGLWDSNSYKRLGWWPLRHIGRINSLVWSPAGDKLASGGNDGIVRLWYFQKEEDTFNLYLCWQTKATHLSTVHLNLTQVIGLSPANYALLQQRGEVIGEPASDEKEKEPYAEGHEYQLVAYQAQEEVKSQSHQDSPATMLVPSISATPHVTSPNQPRATQPLNDSMVIVSRQARKAFAFWRDRETQARVNNQLVGKPASTQLSVYPTPHSSGND